MGSESIKAAIHERPLVHVEKKLLMLTVLTFVCPLELLETKTIRPFSFSFNTSDYRILHMDQDQGRLYLGSREYLVSLDMQNVNKEPLIVRHYRIIVLWNYFLLL